MIMIVQEILAYPSSGNRVKIFGYAEWEPIWIGVNVRDTTYDPGHCDSY